jgi:DNA-binding transcriptional MerR regulator/effector-binding domain-containing protein
MMQRNQKKYSIGELSKISGLSIPTLRFYDEKKLLVPTLRDQNSRYRYYSEEQILVALSIRELRLRDISLKEMTKILHTQSLTILNDILAQKKESIDLQIAELEKSKQLVETTRQIISKALLSKEDFDTNDEIFVSEFPLFNCLYSDSNSRISVNEIFWDRFSELYKLIDQYGCRQTAPIMAVFHEHYTHQFFFDNGHLEVLVPVKEYDERNSSMKRFGGFLTAGIIATGHYNQMLPQYTKLVRWIRENHYEIIGDPIEIYTVEFTHIANSDDYVTEIRFPVRKIELEQR